jgi:hypothetical protein
MSQTRGTEGVAKSGYVAYIRQNGMLTLSNILETILTIYNSEFDRVFCEQLTASRADQSSTVKSNLATESTTSRHDSAVKTRPTQFQPALDLRQSTQLNANLLNGIGSQFKAI